MFINNHGCFLIYNGVASQSYRKLKIFFIKKCV